MFLPECSSRCWYGVTEQKYYIGYAWRGGIKKSLLASEQETMTFGSYKDYRKFVDARNRYRKGAPIYMGYDRRIGLVTVKFEYEYDDY